MRIKDIKCPAVRATATQYAKQDSGFPAESFEFSDTKEGSNFWAKISRGDDLTLGRTFPFYSALGGVKINRFDMRVYNNTPYLIRAFDNKMREFTPNPAQAKEALTRYKKEFWLLISSF
jgi:hypothetical protein